MGLVEIKIDPQVVERIAKALEELVRLTEARALADGYLQPPPERKPTTLEDIRIVDGKSVWQRQKALEQQQRRVEQQIDKLRSQ